MTDPGIPASSRTITADWMRRALVADGATEIPALSAIAVEDIGTGVGLMGDVLRCRLTWAEPSAGAPAKVIVKLPSSVPKNLRMSKQQSLYKREYDYYRRVAEDAPLRSPRLLYGTFEPRSHRFVLVLEDLGHLETGNEIGGATAAQARNAIRAVARLHGHYWNHVDQPAFSEIFDTGDPKYGPLLQIVYLKNLAPTLSRFGSFFSSRARAVAEEYGCRIADHFADLAAGPRTFLHGDYRLENLFFGSGGEGGVAAVDWQVSGIGCGLFDAAYFLGGSVDTEVRRAIERDAVREYAEIVRGTGARAVTFEECWHLYRSAMLIRLLVSVLVCGGLDLSNDRMHRVAEIALTRTLAAIDDLDAGALIPPRRPAFSAANLFSTASKYAYRAYRLLR